MTTASAPHVRGHRVLYVVQLHPKAFTGSRSFAAVTALDAGVTGEQASVPAAFHLPSRQKMSS
jgi:hypothetical protein